MDISLLCAVKIVVLQMVFIQQMMFTKALLF